MREVTRAEVEAGARAYWHHLTPFAGRNGTSYEADPYAYQYREAAQVILAAASQVPHEVPA